MIKYLNHSEIDKTRWDNCLQESVNGMIYGTSWYLDQLNPGWEALVLGDYDAIMPLPAKQKWGIHYLIRPYLCQQLGIFSKEGISAELTSEFIHCIPSHFKWINMPLNEGNYNEKKIITKENGINYILSLNKSYEILLNSFVQNTRRNLSKANDRNILAEYSNEIELFIELKREHAFSSFDKSHIQFAGNIFHRYENSGDAKIVCAMDKDRKMMAGALFIHFKNRWIYLLSASSSKGKETRAMFSIINKFIYDHAGKQEFLDFEGSMIPELARFFGGFGAIPKYYPILKLNRLPFPLTLFKK